MSESDDSSNYIRKLKYKCLLDEGHKINDKVETDNIIDTIKKVHKLITDSNILCNEAQISDRTDNSTEVVMDAQVVKMSHELVGKALSKNIVSEFSDSEYVKAIKNFIKREDGSENWDLLAAESAKICKTTAYALNLYGTFDEVQIPKERIIKERNARNRTLANEKRPEQLKKLNNDEQGAQKINIVMSKIVEAYRYTNVPLLYYKIVIDPKNFMHSVDNAFQLSFLVKDGSIRIENGPDGPTVRPVGKEEKIDSSNRDKSHYIIALNPKLCNEMIEKYDIVDPFFDYERLDPLSQTQNQEY